MSNFLYHIWGVFKHRPNCHNTTQHIQRAYSDKWHWLAATFRNIIQYSISFYHCCVIATTAEIKPCSNLPVYFLVVKIKELEEQGVCIKFCFKLCKTFYRSVWNAWASIRGWWDELNTVLWLVYSFKRGKNIDQRKSKTWTPFNVNKWWQNRYSLHCVNVKILFNCMWGCWGIGYQRGFTSQNLIGKLKMYHISAKFVPCFLSDDQKENCVNIYQWLFHHDSTDENFIKNITGDET